MSIGCGFLGGNYIELVDVSANFTFDGKYVGAAGESRQGVFTHLSCPKCKRKFRPKFWARAFCDLFFPSHIFCGIKDWSPWTRQINPLTTNMRIQPL